MRIRGSATCRAEGVPDFELVLEEVVTFEGEHIIHLEDRYHDGAKEALRAYLDEHQETLAFAITS